MTDNTDNPVFAQFKNDINSNDAVLYMKGTTDFPMCGFSSVVVQILQHSGVQFKDVNVMEDNAVREGIKAFSDWPTIPQLYLKGEFIGGCDIIKDLHESGELASLLKEKGIATAA